MEIRFMDSKTIRVKLSRKQDKEFIDFLTEHKGLYEIDNLSNRYLYLIFRFNEDVDNLNAVNRYMCRLDSLRLAELKLMEEQQCLKNI